ncbi:hypothetical protein KBT16_04465 [Nostoc sp. CCCryo 231-06]|nr:hypothetical protein [Nostoc sp. CCCryo 231-06]
MSITTGYAYAFLPCTTRRRALERLIPDEKNQNRQTKECRRGADRSNGDFELF